MTISGIGTSIPGTALQHIQLVEQPMTDDIPAKGLTVVTYNIYRNGKLLAADIPEAA